MLMGELLLEEVPKAARSAGGDLSDLVSAITTALLVASAMRSTLSALFESTDGRRRTMAVAASRTCSRYADSILHALPHAAPVAIVVAESVQKLEEKILGGAGRRAVFAAAEEVMEQMLQFPLVGLKGTTPGGPLWDRI